MDRKELRKRWIMGTIQPELFYVSWKKKKKVLLYIRNKTHCFYDSKCNAYYATYSTNYYADGVKFQVLDKNFTPINDTVHTSYVANIPVNVGETYYYYELESGIGNKLIKEPLKITITKEDLKEFQHSLYDYDYYYDYTIIHEPNFIEVNIPIKVIDIPPPSIEIVSTEKQDEYNWLPVEFGRQYTKGDGSIYNTVKTTKGQALVSDINNAVVTYDGKKYDYFLQELDYEAVYKDENISLMHGYNSTYYWSTSDPDTVEVELTNVKFADIKRYKAHYINKLTREIYFQDRDYVDIIYPTVAQVTTTDDTYLFTEPYPPAPDDIVKNGVKKGESVDYNFCSYHYNNDKNNVIVGFTDGAFEITYQKNSTTIKELKFNYFIPKHGTKITEKIDGIENVLSDWTNEYIKQRVIQFDVAYTYASGRAEALHEYITGKPFAGKSLYYSVIYKTADGRWQTYCHQSNVRINDDANIEDSEIVERTECILAQFSVARKDSENIIYAIGGD